MSKSRSKSSHRSKNQPTLSKRPAWLFPVLLVGVGALLVGLAIWLFQRSQPTPYTSEIAGAPAAQIDQTRFDYGEVRFNTPVETRFRVRNVGDQPLRILGEPQVELVEGC